MNEDVSGLYTGAPPDQEPMQLETYLQGALDIIGRDGALDPHEQEVIANFCAAIEQIGMQKMGGQDYASPDAPAINQGGSLQQTPDDIAPYGSTGGEGDSEYENQGRSYID